MPNSDQHARARRLRRDSTDAERVLRVWNDEVLRNTEGVLHRVGGALAAS
jgi:very-short-patch-repair endonuclease